ncbi:endonuclease/exonuclease/phosphatase family protein [Shewanella maritima]|uniref:endonuclease/exonuclease/phosphatase family protein n=1 Tax=Shewanella maritima TaxID=2520507 RepID=UPI003735B907
MGDSAVSYVIQERQSLAIASINLFNFIAPPKAFYDFENIYSNAQWKNKQGWLADFIKMADADVVGFQEVFSPNALEALVSSLGYPYFAVVDEPQVITDYVYKSPVVAIASKYPITQVQSVAADAQICAQMGLASEFQFSRKPLRATIQLPVIGSCDCYVIHFKSKRNQLDKSKPLATTLLHDEAKSEAELSEPTTAVTNLTGAAEFVAEQVLGRWGASLQRGSEASLLYHAMVQRRFLTQHPFVLMGDFNDDLVSDLFSAFRQSSRVFRSDIEDKSLAQLSDVALKAELQLYGLFDSYELHQSASRCNKTLAQDEFETSSHYENANLKRPATHYYGNTGSVLDYILVSSEFNHAGLQNIAQIIDYQTFDRHLVKPDYQRDKDSTDHAPVMMTFEIRS